MGFSIHCSTGTYAEIEQLRSGLEYVGIVRDGMDFPWFAVLVDDPGFYTVLCRCHYQDDYHISAVSTHYILFPDLESWQEIQEPFNLREHFGDMIKGDAPSSCTMP